MKGLVLGIYKGEKGGEFSLTKATQSFQESRANKLSELIRMLVFVSIMCLFLYLEETVENKVSDFILLFIFLLLSDLCIHLVF